MPRRRRTRRRRRRDASRRGAAASSTPCSRRQRALRLPQRRRIRVLRDLPRRARDRPVQFQVVSDQAASLQNRFGRVNYEDPNFNVGLPVFIIHGDHDDPAGVDNLSTIDILSVANFVNYFGKVDLGSSGVGQISIHPILLKKGATFVALYGLGNIRDVRLSRMLQTPDAVQWITPEDLDDIPLSDWSNILVLHQNRCAKVKASLNNGINEYLLLRFLDLVIWGHEHECLIDPQEVPGMGFDITQPGPSVATSLASSEAKQKHVLLLEIKGRQYRPTKIPLKTVRPFEYAEVVLEDQVDVDANDLASVHVHLDKVVGNLIEKNNKAAASGSEPKLPLVRIKVDYSGFSTINIQRFGQKYVGKKEKAFNKETKRKVEEMKATINSLRNKKTDLKMKHKGLEATAINLKNTQKELEASLKEKDRHMNQMEEKATNLTNTKKELEASLKERDSRIKQMEEKTTNLQKTQKQLEASLKEKDSRISLMEEKAAAGSNPDQMAALMEILQRKEAELEEIETRFQDYRTTDRKVVSSKSIPAQMSSVNATPDTAVAEKVVNSSNTTISATSEEKRSGNTTGTESKHKKQKARSLEENQVKFTSKTDHDDLEDKTGDAVLDIDDIYGGSHSKKSEFPRRNKKFLIQGEDLDGIGKSGHSQDQGSHEKSLRYNKPLEMVNNKTDETKMKNSTDGHFEKISKDSLSANLNRPKQAVQELAGATDVKLKMSVNDDGTQQQNKRQKKKKSRSKKKKMIDTASTNGDGEVTKVSAVENTSTPESVSELKKVTALQ